MVTYAIFFSGFWGFLAGFLSESQVSGLPKLKLSVCVGSMIGPDLPIPPDFFPILFPLFAQKWTLGVSSTYVHDVALFSVESHTLLVAHFSSFASSS